MRRRFAAAALTLAVATGAAAAASEMQPRPISAAERAAVALAAVYFDEGAAGWWDRLASDAPLRQLGREAAVAEIAVRCGPRRGAVWQLQTPAESLGPHAAVLAIEFPSGVDETLELVLVEEDGWKLREVRSLVDPAPRGERSQASSPLPVAPVVVIVAFLLALPFLSPRPWGSHPRLPLFRPEGLWRVAVLGLGVLLACRQAGPGTDATAGGVAPAAESAVLRLGSLLPLREKLTQGDAVAEAPPADGLLGEAAQLWEAQLLLVRRQLNEAEAIFQRLPSPSRLPLSALLSARFAVLRARLDEVSMAYDTALRRAPEHDGLGLEMAEALGNLGLTEEADVRYSELGRTGSRLAEVHYMLAQFAVYNDEPERGEQHFRTAWNLAPRERARLFANPVLAYLAVRPALLPLLQLSSPTEPVVETAGERQVLAELEGKPARLLGRRLTVEAGGGRIVVPGGAALAPSATPQEDAATAARREEAEALALLTAAPRTAYLRLPLRQLETVSAALGRAHRWPDLLELSESLGGDAELASPDLAQWRARALIEAGREAEARRLLIRLAESDIANRRRDPVTFYQLAELMAASAEYDLAVRLIERANQLTPLEMGDTRIRRLRMEQRLAEAFKRFETEHFQIRYPATAGERYAGEVGLVLEEEMKRLRRWIPVRPGIEIGIDLFPVEEFMASYSPQGLTVLGLYDGRIRLPFAELRSLHPFLVKILSHELTHAMIADYTHDRSPKWLHEGLAEHLQMVQDSANPIPDLHEVSRVLSFPLIEAVLAGFGEAQLVDLAYREAAWVLHYVEARHGVKGIHRLLDAFAAGHDTEKALEQAFGLSPVDFEKAAWEWCLNDAPPVWPTELRRYDRELHDPYVRKTSRVAALPKNRKEEDKRITTPRVRTYQPPPAAQAPAEASPMKLWHATYAERVRPIKSALVPVIRAFRSPERPADVDALCRRLNDLVVKLLADDSVFRSPDRGQAGRRLKLAYQRFAKMGRACREGRDAVVRGELGHAEVELREAAKILAPFGLEP